MGGMTNVLYHALVYGALILSGIHIMDIFDNLEGRIGRMAEKQ
jgi:phosphoribosyl-ATP pyrophosphohydrolase